MLNRYGGSISVLLFKDNKIRLQAQIDGELADEDAAHNAAGTAGHEMVCPTGPPDLDIAA